MNDTNAGRRGDGLPRQQGFRIRGAGMTRIETFTDAAFAFALTLLVVSAETPGSYEELLAALQEIPAFAASAVLLLLFWWGHRNWSRRFGLEDGTTVLLSCILVFTVLVYVYPLRFMASAFMTWIGIMTGWPLGGEPVAMDLAEVNGMFVVYGIGWVAMCGCLVLLNLHAWRRSEALELDGLERLDTRDEITAWLLVGSAGLLSILLALTTGSSWYGLPGWAYALLGVVMPLFSWYSERRKAGLLARDAGEDGEKEGA